MFLLLSRLSLFVELDGDDKKAKKRKKEDKERERSRGRDRRGEEKGERRRRSRSDSPDPHSLPPVQPAAAYAFDHEFEEMKWALNMGLIGNCPPFFASVPDQDPSDSLLFGPRFVIFCMYSRISVLRINYRR
jgi:hypothetical protein